MENNNSLELDLEETRQKIIDFIKKQTADLNKQGAVVGLSGGIDSALVLKLCVEALGPDNVIAVMLPERDSGGQNAVDAKKFASDLGVRVIYKKLDLILYGLVKGFSTGDIMSISGAADEEIKRVSLYTEKSDYLRKWPITLQL